MSADGFKEGCHVLVLSLNKRGTVIECRNGTVCKVAVGSLTLTVPVTGLSRCEPGSAELGRPLSHPPRPSARSTMGPKSIDLHGLSVDDAVRALETWLNAAIIAGHNQLEVVHGLGSGKVQRAVHETLANYSAVRAFRINDRNPGMTDVFVG